MNFLIDSILYLLSAVFAVLGMVILRIALANQDIEHVIASPETLLRLALGTSLYLGGIAVWLLVMIRIPLGIAYPIATGLVIVASVLGGQIFLAEMITIKQWSGVMAIMLGIILLSKPGDDYPNWPKTFKRTKD